MAVACGTYTLIATNGNDCSIYPMRCRTWTCPRCGPWKARRISQRVQAGINDGRARWLTVTSPPSETPAESYAAFPHRWKLLHQRLIRITGHKIEYLAVVESQLRGSAHAHVVFRGGYIPHRLLRAAAVASGFGPIVDIRAAHAGLPDYLAKQLTHALPDAPRSFRRVRISRGWPTAPTATISRPADTSWWRAYAPPQVVAAAAALRGYRIVELVPGRMRRFARWLLSAVWLPCSPTEEWHAPLFAATAAPVQLQGRSTTLPEGPNLVARSSLWGHMADPVSPLLGPAPALVPAGRRTSRVRPSQTGLIT